VVEGSSLLAACAPVAEVSLLLLLLHTRQCCACCSPTYALFHTWLRFTPMQMGPGPFGQGMTLYNMSTSAWELVGAVYTTQPAVVIARRLPFPPGAPMIRQSTQAAPWVEAVTSCSSMQVCRQLATGITAGGCSCCELLGYMRIGSACVLCCLPYFQCLSGIVRCLGSDTQLYICLLHSRCCK
jgi:hypothetical protein